MENNAPIVELPDFLMEIAPVTPVNVLKELMEQTFGNMIESVMEGVAEGRSLEELVRESPHNVDPKKYRSWILRDPARKKRYYDAKAIGIDAVEDEIIRIADAVDTMEDVQRSQLRIKARMDILKINNPQRYGEKADGASFGSGGVVINITGVTSPYLKTEDKTLTIDQE